MKAKQFFHVCAGILVLASVQQVTARRVSAQGPQLLFVEEVSPQVQFAVDSLGRIYQLSVGTWEVVAQLPPGTPVHIAGASAMNSGGFHTRFLIGMANGDVWLMLNAAQQGWSQVEFRALGNIFSGNVQVDGTSWSKMKGAYRK